jgi:hypothetical protein
MAEWLILLVLVPAIVVPVVLLVGFAGCGFEHGLGPRPVIESAVATGSSSIRLAWRCCGQTGVRHEFKRTKLPGEIEERLFDAVSYDDTGLLPATSYVYRLRHVSSDGEINESHPVAGTTLSFTTFDETSLLQEEAGWEGHCLVQRIEAARLSTSGTLVCLTLHASSVGASINRIYISQPDPAGDLYDSRGDLTMVFEGLTPLVLSPNEVVPLPAVTYPLDAEKPLLVAVDFNALVPSGIMYKEVPPEDAIAYYKQAPDEAPKTDRTGYTRWPADMMKGGIYLIEKIEVG